MLEGLAAGILSSYLGQWIEGLERENLKIGIKQGNVTIENLKLRKDALADLNLPLAIKAGFLGKLQLIIPWQNLSSKPAVIRIERVFLVAGPLAPEKFDAQQEDKKAQDSKQQRLALRELFNKKDAKEESDTFTNRLIAKVVANLQLFVDKIHIRYEDGGADPTRPFAFGITLERLYAQTTDHDWNPTFMKENQLIVYKLVSLSNFSIYWDSSTFFMSCLRDDHMKQSLEDLIHETGKEAPYHNYLLQPISSTLKVVMNKNTDLVRDLPKFTLTFFFDRIALELQENQYRELMSLLENFGLYQCSLKYRALKPSVSPIDSPRAWWHFAANALLSSTREKKRKWSFPYLKQANIDRKIYVRLYKQKLDLALKKQKLSPESQDYLNKLEARLDYDRIVLFRSLAEAFQEKEREFREKEKKKKQETDKSKPAENTGFWRRLSSWSSSDYENLDLELTDDVWKELYAAVEDEYSPTSNETITTTMHLRVEEGSLQLKPAPQTAVSTEWTSPTLLLFTFHGYDVTLHTTEGYTTMKIDGKLETMQAFDFYTKKTKFPIILTPAVNAAHFDPSLLEIGESDLTSPGASGQLTNIQREESEFFKFHFAINPPGTSDADYSFSLNMKPLNVIFNENIVMRILNFFKIAQEDSGALVRGVEEKLASDLDKLKDYSYHQFAWMLQYKKTLNLDIHIDAPIIIIPQSLTEEDCPSVVIDLGHLSLQSDLSAERDIKAAQTQEHDHGKCVVEAREDDFYSKFLLNMTSLHAFIATNPQDDWRTSCAKSEKEKRTDRQQIIKEFDINLTVLLTKLHSDVLTTLRVEGALPCFEVCLSSWACRSLVQIISARLSFLFETEDERKEEQEQAKQLIHSMILKSQEVKFENSHSATQAALTEPELFKKRSLIIKRLLDKKIMEFAFSVHTLKMSIYESKSKNAKEESLLVNFLAKGMAMRFIKREFDLVLQGNVQMVQIEDHFQKWGEAYKDLLVPHVQEQSNLPLLGFSFVIRQENSPEFTLTNDLAPHSLDITLRGLHLMCNGETVFKLSKFVNANIISQFQLKAPKRTEVNTAKISRSSSFSVQHANLLAETAPLMKVTLNLGSIKFTLNHQGLHIAEGSLDHTTISVKLNEEDDMFVKGSIGYLSIRDLSDTRTEGEHLFREFISIKGDNVIKLSVELYNTKKRFLPKPTDIDTLRVDISSVNATLSLPFLTELLSYVAEIKSLLAATAPSPEHKNEQRQQLDNDFFKIDVSLRNAVLVIPERLDSPHVAIAYGPFASISNKAYAQQIGSSFELFESIKIGAPDITLDLATLELGSHRGSKQFVNRQNLAKHAGLELSIDKPELKTLSRGLPLDINLTFPKIDLGMTMTQAKHVFTIVEQIFGDLFAETGFIPMFDRVFEDPPRPFTEEVLDLRRLTLLFESVSLRINEESQDSAISNPHFVLGAENLSVVCFWKSNDCLVVEVATRSAFLDKYLPKFENENSIPFVIVGCELKTKEGKGLKVTYKTEEGQRNKSHREQHVEVYIDNLSGVLAKQIMDDFWSCFDVIWEAVQKIMDKTGPGKPVEKFLCKISLSNPSHVLLSPRPDFKLEDKSKENMFISSKAPIEFLITRDFAEPGCLAFQEFALHASNISLKAMNTHEDVLRKKALIKTKGLLFYYNKPYGKQASFGKAMTFDMLSLSIAYSAMNYEKLVNVLKAWGSEDEPEKVQPTEDFQPLRIKANIEKGDIFLIGDSGLQSSTHLAILCHAVLEKLRLNIELQEENKIIRGDADSLQLFDSLQANPELRQVIEMCGSNSLYFLMDIQNKGSWPVEDKRLTVRARGVRGIMAHHLFCRLLRLLLPAKDPSERKPPIKLDVVLDGPTLHLPQYNQHASLLAAFAQQFTITNHFFATHSHGEEFVVEKMQFGAQGLQAFLGTLPVLPSGNGLWHPVTTETDLVVSYERPLHDPLRKLVGQRVHIQTKQLHLALSDEQSLELFRVLEETFSGLYGDDGILALVDKAFPSPVGSPPSHTYDIRHLQLEIPSLQLDLGVPSKTSAVSRRFSLNSVRLKLDNVWRSNSTMCCNVTSPAVVLSESVNQLIVAMESESLHGFTMTYETMKGKSPSTVCQRLDLQMQQVYAVASKEAFYDLGPAVGMLWRGLQKAVAKTGPGLPSESFEFCLLLRSPSVAFCHPRTFEQQSDVHKTSLPYFVCRASEMNMRWLQPNNQDEDRFEEIKMEMSELEVCKSRNTFDPEADLGTMLSSSDFFTLVEPGQASMTMMMKPEAKEITFMLDTLHMTLPLKDINTLLLFKEAWMGNVDIKVVPDSKQDDRQEVSTSIESKPSIEWSCERCTLINPAHVEKCEMCKTPRAASVKNGGQEAKEEGKLAVVSVPSGKWSCSQCTYVNQPQATICSICEEKRPMTQSADKRELQVQDGSEESTRAIQASAHDPYKNSISDIKPREFLRLNSLNFVIYLIDDDENVPLFQISSQADISMSDWSSDTMQFLVLFNSIHVNYFNKHKEVSECLLEPWFFQLKVSTNPLNVQITSPQRMELNITRPFIEMATQLFKSEHKWDAEEQILENADKLGGNLDKKLVMMRPENALKHNQSLSIIRNETGRDIYFLLIDRREERGHDRDNTKKVQNWACQACTTINAGQNRKCAACGAQRKREDIALETEWELLEPSEYPTPEQASSHNMKDYQRLVSGEEMILHVNTLSLFKSTRRLSRKRSLSWSGDRYFLCVQIDGPFKILRNIPLHPTGQYSLDVTPEGSKRRQEKISVVCEVTHRKGSKLVVLRSPISLDNRTQVPIRILAELELTQSPFEIVCPPNSSVPIPLTLVAAGESSMRMVPEGDDAKWQYSAQQIKCGTDLRADTKFLTCRPIAPPNETQSFYPEMPPFVLRVTIKGNNKGRRIVIDPPMKLHNLLPIDVIYKVYDMETKKCSSMMSGVLSKGQSADLHVFEPHKIKGGLGLSIQIEGFKWGAPVILNEAEMRSFCVFDSDKNPLKLQLLLQKREGGLNHIYIFVDYWVINKTGLKLLCQTGNEEHKSMAAGQQRSLLLHGKLQGQAREWYKPNAPLAIPTPQVSMLSFLEKDHSLFVSLANSKLSEGISLKSAYSVAITLADSQSPALFQLGTAIEEAPGKFWRTKIVSFAPYRILVNKLKTNIEYRQEGSKECHSLMTDESIPLHWSDRKLPKRLRIRLAGDTSSAWSGAFSMSTDGQHHSLRISSDGARSHDLYPIVRIEVKLEGASMFVFIKPESKEHPLYRVENLSSFNLQIAQKDKAQEDVAGFTSVSFGWNEPDESKTVVMKMSKNQKDCTTTINFDEFARYAPIRLFYPQIVTIQVTASGPTKVLRVTEEVVRNKGTEAIERQTAEEEKEEEKEELQFHISLASIGISLIDETPQELLYATLTAPQFDYSLSDLYQKIELVVKDLQIDNQLHSSSFPILLAPIKDPRSRMRERHQKTTEEVNVLHFSAIKVNNAKDVEYYKYLACFVHPMDIKIEGSILMKLVELKNAIMKSLTFSTQEGEREKERDLFEPPALKLEDRMLCFSFFLINPISCRLSFKYVSGIDYSSIHSLISWTGGFANLDSAPLTFNALLLNNTLSSHDGFFTQIKGHYSNQLQKQFGKLLGHLSVFGAPLSLMSNISSSVSDMFSDPNKAFVKSPKDFDKGVDKGLSLLMAKSVQSVNKMNASLNSGGGLLTDADRQSANRERNKPSGVIEGVSHGVKDLTSGFVQGITGVVTEPIAGAVQEGVWGLSKGVAKGVLGLGAKPLSGAMSFVSQTIGGIQASASTSPSGSTSAIIDSPEQRSRTRVPRNLAHSERVGVYDVQEAEGSDLLYNLEGGKYRAERYKFHYRGRTGQARNILLISNRCVFYIKYQSPSSLLWHFPIQNMTRCEKSEHGVQIWLDPNATSGGGMLGIALSGGPPTRFVYCDTERDASWLQRNLLEAQKIAQKQTEPSPPVPSPLPLSSSSQPKQDDGGPKPYLSSRRTTSPSGPSPSSNRTTSFLQVPSSRALGTGGDGRQRSGTTPVRHSASGALVSRGGPDFTQIPPK